MSICRQLGLGAAEAERTYGLEGVTGGRDEEDAAVDARVGDEALAHGGELLAEVCRVLVLNVLDDGLPAVVVVYEVTVAGRVDNVELEAHAVLDDGCGEPCRRGRSGRRAKAMARRTCALYSPWLLT